MRDKLIELIVNGENELFRQRNYFTDMERIEHTADYLLSHGVTLATDKNVGDKKPFTNGDRTRAMSDYELAKFVGIRSLCGYIQDHHYELCETRGVCRGCVEEWLKQSVEEET